MQKISLNGAWQGVCYCENGNVDFKFDGTVPGCVHTDFINTKIIDYDIFYRDNADKCQWIENRNFDYEKAFTLEQAPSKAELVFEGLDTYTDIYLNGELLASTDDMWLFHTKDQGTPEVPNIHFTGNFARKVLGEFKNGEDKVFKLKYAQFEGCFTQYLAYYHFS